jgi:tetratricopeptide (TPR) repeat protein
MPAPAGLSKRGLVILGAFTIFIATFISYWPALRGGFIWDDDRHVSENSTLRSVDGLRRIWFRWGATPQYYPMTHTSFWIEYHLWGLKPTGYHVTNVVLHAINALLLWWLLVVLEVRSAWLVAAIFALHPINVESVAWISERKNVLAMCLGLLSMLMFLRQSNLTAAVLLFCLAMLSKTFVATVPAVLLLLLWWKRGRIERRDVFSLAPMFVIAIGMSVMTAVMESRHVGARGEDWALSFLDRLLIAGRAICFYVWKLLCPVRLTFSYERWDVEARSWRWVCPIAVLFVICAAALSRKRLGKGILVGILIFVGALFPALGFINIYPMRYSFVADHFVYLSAPALISLLVVGGMKLLRQWLFPVGAVVLVILAGLTWKQAHVYQGAETIWRDTIHKNPSSWMARFNLAVCLSVWSDNDRVAGDEAAARGKLDEALSLLDQVQRLRPQHDKLQQTREQVLAKALDLGLMLAGKGQPADAKPLLERYVVHRPDDLEARIALGYVYGELGQFGAAETQFEDVLKKDSSSVRAQQGLDLARKGLSNTSGK